MYIEMIRDQEKLNALKFAKTYLTPFMKQHLKELQFILVGMVVHGEPGWTDHQILFSDERWTMLERTFYHDVLQLNNMPTISPLELYLQVQNTC